METLHFSIEIHASKEKVWNALWEDTNYRKWTSVFMAGSYAESDWNEGSKIRFLSSDGNGMFSRIAKKTPHEQMVFEHLGEIKNGVEETQDWGGAKEAYFLSGNQGVTHLKVELDTNEEYAKYFSDTFPKALAEVKNIAEN
ncbi:MAG: SRPBCC domain-containing protein [Saprospiraceae bacterium]